MLRGRDGACGLFLRQPIRSLSGLVHEGTLDQVDRLQTYYCEWESVHRLRNRNRNYCRHNGRLWKLTIEHTDHVTRLPLEEELLDVPEYQGVSIEEWATYLFDKKINHCSARTLACVSYVNSVGSSVPQ